MVSQASTHKASGSFKKQDQKLERMEQPRTTDTANTKGPEQKFHTVKYPSPFPPVLGNYVNLARESHFSLFSHTNDSLTRIFFELKLISNRLLELFVDFCDGSFIMTSLVVSQTSHINHERQLQTGPMAPRVQQSKAELTLSVEDDA
ncbi:MAG: hypothetical protein EZS28_031086 [Streblomastix strix]|uniref:Uncharacterized protein n=1 Tax=Streblomastix strix TaxID=222440 RepID=A0A5J4USK5_9EUKA|nr:MAG: hypothetical protein EZS28_031086 [Streblomastix strix]